MSEAIDRERVVQALSNSTRVVFSTMLNMEMRAEAAYPQASKPGPADGVVALVGLTGKWMGTGSLCCSAWFAREMSGYLLKSEFASVDQDVLDAVGEVTSMVIGNFKVAVEDYMGPLGLSIPMVIFGHNFTSRSMSSGDWIVVPFFYGASKLEVKVCLSLQDDKQIERQRMHAQHLTI